MSIINKMHQDFQQLQQAQPILASLPEKRSPQKALLLLAISLLLGSSLVLAYLIFSQGKVAKAAAAQTITTEPLKVEALVPDKVAAKVSSGAVQNKPKAKPLIVDKIAKVEKAFESRVVETASAPAKQEKKRAAGAAPAASAKAVVAKTSPQKQISAEQKLEIKVSQLSKAELAELHIKEADKAQAQGDFELAVKKKLQALALQPTLNELRKSLALYYYGQGDVDGAQSLLKKGVLASPDYPDFNLMLSRIALKEGDQQKAYLYLEQNPPKVEGNLDYYASYAILAQKFQKYAQSERLYSSLLTQRPNNGRWRMSLAIVQDKQDKREAAVNNYKKALLQTDLSAKAKVYINQRLAYLGQN